MSIQFVPLPYPTTQYNQQYVNELIRILNLHFRLLQNASSTYATKEALAEEAAIAAAAAAKAEAAATAMSFILMGA